MSIAGIGEVAALQSQPTLMPLSFDPPRLIGLFRSQRENNCSGSAKALATVKARLGPGRLDGKHRIAVEDKHISGAGAVGVWTKADSVTLFDDFSFGSIAP